MNEIMDDDDNTLQFENGKVIAGSINNLIGFVNFMKMISIAVYVLNA